MGDKHYLKREPCENQLLLIKMIQESFSKPVAYPDYWQQIQAPIHLHIREIRSNRLNIINDPKKYLYHLCLFTF